MRRRVGYLQRHPPATPKPCVLADIIREAPRLLHFLPPDSWSALSSSSRLLRQLMHDLTKTVSVEEGDDLKLLCKGHWPQLGLVLLHKYRGCYIDDSMIKGKLQLQAKLDLVIYSEPARRYSAALIVRSKAMRHKAKQSNIPAPTMLQLQSPQWSKLESLTLSNSQLRAEGLAQLAAINWPKLRGLNLSGNDLGAVGLAQLTDAWPQLQTLNVSNTKLDRAAMTQLVQGKWPLLETLDLSWNPLLEAAALALLSTADWPCVKTLHLTQMQLDVPCLQELVQISWTRLQSLQLGSTGLSTDAIAQLAHADWPLLWTLSCSENKLGPEAVGMLVTVPLPQLLCLDLQSNKLTAAAAKQLAQGNWPVLHALVLRDNYLDDAAMFHLACGQWPELHSLCLTGNRITALGIEFLTHSSWLRLRKLDLDIRAISAQIWMLLSLDPDSMPDAQHVASLDVFQDVSATRQVDEVQALPDQTVLWPFMKSVDFAAHSGYHRKDGSTVQSKLPEWCRHT